MPELANEPVPLDNNIRILLLIASLLVFIIGIPLYILPELTETYFAWTINPPLTAAFLGAGYWASFILELQSARERSWVRARLAVPSVIAFTFLTLIVTLIHLDRFHLSSPDLITITVTWAWIGVYATVPFIMGWLLVKQMQKPRIKQARIAPLSRLIRISLSMQGISMILIGILMLVLPDLIIPVWPWTLSALTSRAIGAWGVGIGIIAIHAAWENDWSRLTPMMHSNAIYGILQLINIIRFPTTLQWENSSAIIYTLFMVSILVIGLYGSWKVRNYKE